MWLGYMQIGAFKISAILQCSRKTFMIHQTFVRWALYILFKFVKSLIRHLGLAIRNVRHVRWFSWTLILLKNFHGTSLYEVWLNYMKNWSSRNQCILSERHFSGGRRNSLALILWYERSEVHLWVSWLNKNSKQFWCNIVTALDQSNNVASHADTWAGRAADSDAANLLALTDVSLASVLLSLFTLTPSSPFTHKQFSDNQGGHTQVIIKRLHNATGTYFSNYHVKSLI